MELTVMTFNLRTNVAEDGSNAWPFRVEAAARMIRESDADIVCTQEGHYSMLLDLEKLLQGYDWIGQGRMGGIEDEFCAIFYRKEALQAVQSGHFSLSEDPDRFGLKSWNSAFPRMCTWVQFQSRQEKGMEFVVFNTHLDHISEEARINGIRLVGDKMQDVRRSIDKPSILTGDFNTEPASETVQHLDSIGLTNAYTVMENKAVGCTYHEFNGGENGEPIDYIFTTVGMTVNDVRIDRRMMDGRFPSDHYPVVAQLTVK